MTKIKRDKNERQSSNGKKDQKVVTNIITNNNINNFIINNPKIEVGAGANPAAIHGIAQAAMSGNGQPVVNPGMPASSIHPSQI